MQFSIEPKLEYKISFRFFSFKHRDYINLNSGVMGSKLGLC